MKPSFPEGYDFGLFSTICGLIGIVVGWLAMARMTGEKTSSSVTLGLRASALLVFWGTLVFALREMIVRSVDRRYDTVQEALEGTFEIMIEYGTLLVQSGTTLTVLIAGGVLGGMFTKWAAVRWN